jgi:hypothetical protein
MYYTITLSVWPTWITWQLLRPLRFIFKIKVRPAVDTLLENYGSDYLKRPLFRTEIGF